MQTCPLLCIPATDLVLENSKARQAGPLDEVWAIVFLGAIHRKMRTREPSPDADHLPGPSTEPFPATRSCWISGPAKQRGQRCWPGVLTEHKNCGAWEANVVSIDGLVGFREAVEIVLPTSDVCLPKIRMVRGWLKYASWTDRRGLSLGSRGGARPPLPRHQERA